MESLAYLKIFKAFILLPLIHEIAGGAVLPVHVVITQRIRQVENMIFAIPVERHDVAHRFLRRQARSEMNRRAILPIPVGVRCCDHVSN